jgi:hypothetical protein
MGLRQAIAAVVLVAVGVGIAYGVYLLVKDSQRANSFESVSLGMSEGTVVDTMGMPDDRHDGCLDAPSWLGRPVPQARCEFELMYTASFGPKFWTVGFDDSGQVIAKYQYVSP